MTELNEIIEKYSALLGYMEQLENEVPLIEEIYQELQSIIKEQSNVENKTLSKIKKQADESIEIVDRIEAATLKLKQQYDEYDLLVKSSKKQQDEFLKSANEKISLLQKLSQKQTSDIDVTEIFSRLSTVENTLAILESQERTPTSDKLKTQSAPKQSRSTYATAKSSFPSDAKHFTFDDIKHVTRKKPYGIVIEGNIIKVQYWTNMLDSVIPYVFDKYDGDVNELCESNYGAYLPQNDGSEKFVPYFVKGSQYTDKNNLTYRPISKVGLSVRYSGAEETVEVLRLLLCDYFGIDERAVELFYHDNK